MMVIYNSVLLPLEHILYSLRTFYLFIVAFHTSNLTIIGSYFRVLEDPSPTQDSFNPYDLHLDSTLAIHVSTDPLACFHTFAFVLINSAAVKIGVRVSFPISVFVFFISILRSQFLGHMAVLLVIF